jgi:hypothetical protein
MDDRDVVQAKVDALAPDVATFNARRGQEIEVGKACPHLLTTA